jgi:hypothetical protein
MECNRLSKSTLQSTRMCVWKTDQHKNRGIKSISSPAGQLGNDSGKWWENVDSGKYDFEVAEQVILETFPEKGAEIVELVQNALNNDPFHLKATDEERKTAAYQQWLAIDDHGKATKKRDEILGGYVDRIHRWANGVVNVTDFKSGWMEIDFPEERYYYVLLAMSKYPDAKQIEFAYLYGRTGKYELWLYDIKSKNEIIETHPDGKHTTHRFKENPFLFYARHALDKIRALEVIPNPGPHCESWFGAPCQFFGKECPLTQENLPAAIEGAVDLVEGQKGETLAMLQGIIDGTVTDKALIEKAYAGHQQLAAWLKKLEKAIKGWSEKNGPIRIGESDYGWFTVPERVTDKVAALDEMLRSDMTIEEIAKVVSIAPTSIDKNISKRQHPMIREYLLKSVIDTVDSKPKFGPIKSELTEGASE